MKSGLKQVLSAEDLAKMVNPPSKLSLSAIGKFYDVSRQRVHQILQEYKKQYPKLFIETSDPTKSEIKELLDKNNSLVSIAEKFKITTGYLKKKMEEYELEKKFIKDILTKDVLLDLYVKQDKTDKEIADAYNCSANTVMKLRYINEIYQDMKKTWKEKLSKELFIDLYFNKNMLLDQIKDLFNTNIQNVIKLKKEYEKDKEFSMKEKGRKAKFRARGVSEEEFEKIKNILIEKGVI